MWGWLILAVAVACGGGGFVVGKRLEVASELDRELTRATKVIAVQRDVIREVPKIIEKYVQTTVTIKEETERVIEVTPKRLPDDCIMPTGFGELLVGAARGITPNASGTIDETAGTYGCAEILTATVRDLQAGRTNSARLAGLQEYVRLTSSPSP